MEQEKRSCESRGWMPLTLAQLDFWEEYALHPDQSVSTVAHCLDIEGAVDQPALVEAITRTVHEADILSVRFRLQSRGDEPLQRCDTVQAPMLELHDLRGQPDPLQAAQRLMQEDLGAQLDLMRQPLSAQWLLRVGERRYLWYSRGHHIILDGYGMVLIERRCAQLYAHLLGYGEAGEPLRPFASFLDEETAYRRSRRFDEDRRYWQAYLEACPTLPVLHKGAEADAAEQRHAEVALPREFAHRLRELSDVTGIGWPDLLVMLSGAYLLQYALAMGETGSLPVWLPFMSRWGSVAAHVPSLAVNILPLHLTSVSDEPLGDFLQRVARVLRQQRRHGRYRIEQIAADRGLAKGTRFLFSPLINVLPFDPPTIEGCRVARQILASGPGDGFDLTYRGCSDGTSLLLSLDADPAAIDQVAFGRHRRELPAFLSRAVAAGGLSTSLGCL
ncbi:condensation domain-containing protein [Halomonas faecis]|uniref:condensation domain-containing protein n=1 Tax=Halomonas faecis TaxID=1562110 RepID=UPI0013D207EE|nr:condensation domain-containing protein [Halomonas faecis]